MPDQTMRSISDEPGVGRDGGDEEHDKGIEQESAYGDTAAFTKLFGNHPRTKILIAFLGDPKHDLNAEQIAESAGLSTSTVYKHIDHLEELGVVSKSRKVSGSQMYRLETNDPLVEHLGQLQVGLSQRMAEIV